MGPNKKYDVALIYQVTETEMKKEWDNYETKQRYDTTHVCMCVYGGALDYPKIVSKGCKDIVDSWEMVALTSREHGDPPKPVGVQCAWFRTVQAAQVAQSSLVIRVGNGRELTMHRTISLVCTFWQWGFGHFRTPFSCFPSFQGGDSTFDQSVWRWKCDLEQLSPSERREEEKIKCKIEFIKVPKKPPDPPPPPTFATEFGKDGLLKKKFVKPLEEACKLLHSHIMKMHDAIMESKRIRHLYVLLSTAAIVRNRLWFYCEKIEKDINKPIQDQYARFRTLVDVLLQEAMNYHANLLQHCVLVDAESMDWTRESSSRNNRLSDHLLFWWCHMQGLKADLWEILPPKLAQDIFAGAMIESLAIVGLRYAEALPCLERLEQYRVDIMSTLLFSSDMILAACSTLRDVVDNPEIQQKIPFCIGLRCQMLLLLATVIGCPLGLLQKFLKKTKGKLDSLAPEPTGLLRSVSPNRSATMSASDTEPSLADADEGSEQAGESRTIQTPLNFWMTAVRPDLYPSSPHYASSGNLISSNDPPTPQQLLFLQVSFLAAQPRPQWHLILQALLSHDFGLATCLFMNLEQQQPTVSDWYSLQELKQPDFCNGCLCSSSGCCDPGTKLTTQDVYSSLLHLLVHAGGSDHDVLLKTLLPAIRPRLDLQHFDKSQVWNAVRPHWLQALVWVIDPYLVPVFDDVIVYVRSLPHVDDVCTENVIKRVLVNLKEMSLMMPHCIRKFVNALDVSLRSLGGVSRSVQPTCGSLCIHLLVNAIFTFEHTAIHVSTLGGGDPELSKAEVTIISNAKERLCHLQDNEEDEQMFATELEDVRLAFLAVEEKKDMLTSNKLAMLKKLDICSCGEEVAQILVAPILTDIQGKQALQILHNTLSHNVYWVRQVLGIPGPYMMETMRAARQDLQIPSWKAFGAFNPFQTHRTFQGLPLQQAQLAAYPMNWDLVFAFVFTPLSTRNAQTLLKNRPDLNAPDGYLDAETKRCVEYMKRHYDLDGAPKK